MSDQTRTPWISPDVKPVRAGVYERDDGQNGQEAPRYAFWDGERWHGYVGPHHGPGAALGQIGYHSALHLRWRGLAQEPK